MDSDPTPPDVPNPALRQYAAGGFTMHLTRHHVTMLVAVAAWEQGYTHSDTTSLLPSHFVTAARGLIDRGLVVHDARFDPYFRTHGYWAPARVDNRCHTYRLTRAGRLVEEMLYEAGVWQETWAKLPASPSGKPLPKVEVPA